MQSKWIPVFRTGTWQDSSGNIKTWSEKDLDNIVSKFRAGETEAPAVIGHPKDNSPAYGWVEELRREGEVLLARIKPTVSEFVEWLKKKIYNKVSISLYGDGTLRHVGFLGAIPPAVKGLKMPEFAEGEFAVWEFEEKTNKEQKKQEVSMSEQEKRALNDRIEKLERENKEFSEEKAKLEKSFQESEEREQKAQGELRKIQLNMKKMEYQQFLNEEMAFGALTENQKETAIKILEVLDTTEFAEDAKIKPAEEFKEFLKGLPAKTVEGEIATKSKVDETATVSEGKFDKKVKEYMEENNTNYRDAVIAVSNMHPELYEEARIQ